MTDRTSKEQSVQRFSGWGIAMMQNKPTTEYVLASDYDALAAQMRTAPSNLLARAVELLQLGASSDERSRLRKDIEAFLRSPRETTAESWIALTDRLPEGDEHVLVSMSNGHVKTDLAWYVRGTFLADRERCVFTHWMPTPPSAVKSEAPRYTWTCKCGQVNDLAFGDICNGCMRRAPKINEQPSAPAAVRPTLSEPNSLGSAAGVDLTISRPPQ